MTKQHYVLFAIESIGNTGDEIIAETSEWLLQNTGALLEGTLRCQLIPGYKDMVKHYKLCVCFAF